MITERLVDIVDTGKMAVVHTFPIAIDAGEAVPHEAEFERKASAAAAIALPDADLGTLGTQMHVERGGPLQPYGDGQGSLVMTKEGVERETRARAYALWQAEGCPEGHADAHWHGAQHGYRCERAHCLWQAEGCPEGNAHDHWFRALQFE